MTHRYLVTGAAGFIGANLLRRLVERGETVAGVFTKTHSDAWRFRYSGIFPHHCHTFCDLANPETFRYFIDEFKPTIVYHCATHGAYHRQTDAQRIIRTNVEGTLNLLNACAKNGFGLFVNLGSSSEYGPKRQAMREDDVCEPTSVYGVAKLAQTNLCRQFALELQLPIVTLRLFSVYGPWEEPGRLVPNLMRAMATGKSLKLADPETVRDFVNVDDVVDIALRMREGFIGERGDVYNIGSGVQTTLAEVMQEAARLQGKTLTTDTGYIPRPWDTDCWVADISRARQLLGFRPRSLREGLAQTWEWFKEHRENYEART
jgi:nucleoside-diphosphate-sugar epimerase